MAKSKKRSKIADEKMKPGMTAASLHAHISETEDFADMPEEMPEEKPEKSEKPIQDEDGEKELLMQLVRRLMDDMGASSLSDLGEMIDKAEERKLMRAHGLDEGAAQLFLKQQEKVRTLREAEAKAAREAAYIEMQKDPIFDDVDTRKNAMEAFILRTGVSPREAYLALFAEERLRRMQQEMDAMRAETEKKEKFIPALSGGNAPDKKTEVQLSEAEKRMAQKAGMTPQEYARFKYAY